MDRWYRSMYLLWVDSIRGGRGDIYTCDCLPGLWINYTWSLHLLLLYRIIYCETYTIYIYRH